MVGVDVIVPVGVAVANGSTVIVAVFVAKGSSVAVAMLWLQMTKGKRVSTKGQSHRCL